MRMRGGTAISLVGHGAVLVWALVSFARPLDPKLYDTMPVDLISAEEFSKMTTGAAKAPQQEEPKPLVEKIAEAKPVEDVNAKVVEKKEVTAAIAEAAPEPKPKEPDPKPAAAPPEPKTEAKAPENKKEPEQKIDPIAEAIKKEETKKPEKKAETKPQPVKKPEPQQPKFDPRKVAELLDKRSPQRLASAGASLNSTASLGAPKGQEADSAQAQEFRRSMETLYGRGMRLGLAAKDGLAAVAFGNDDAALRADFARLRTPAAPAKSLLALLGRIEPGAAGLAYHVDFGAMMGQMMNAMQGVLPTGTLPFPEQGLAFDIWGGIKGRTWSSGVAMDVQEMIAFLQKMQGLEGK